MSDIEHLLTHALSHGILKSTHMNWPGLLEHNTTSRGAKRTDLSSQFWSLGVQDQRVGGVLSSEASLRGLYGCLLPVSSAGLLSVCLWGILPYVETSHIDKDPPREPHFTKLSHSRHHLKTHHTRGSGLQTLM